MNSIYIRHEQTIFQQTICYPMSTYMAPLTTDYSIAITGVFLLQDLQLMRSF